MTDDIDETSVSSTFRRDAIVISLSIITIGVIGFYDIYEDWAEGVSLGHLYFESLINVLELVAGAYLFLRIVRSKSRTIQEIRAEFQEARKSATDYKNQVDKFREGITGAIGEQFKVWKLTPAEEEICLLLLKGFSLQEIAELRQTSERTIRQQASNMYKKTGISGRAQLSAFFLEDMLVMKE